MIKIKIKKTKDLYEKRSNPESNIKTPILKQLEPFSNDETYFVSFTDLEKIGLNPNNRFSTPIGVYAYNLKDLWPDWSSGDSFFGDDRKYVNLIKLSTDKVLNLSNYKNFSKDLKYLKKNYEKDFLQKLNNKSFESFIEEVKSNADLYKYDSQSALIWGLTQAISQIEDKKIGAYTKKSTVFWNKMLRDMGYDVVIDKGSNIHILQSSQAVFLAPSSYKVVGRLVNKSYGLNTIKDNYWGSKQQPFWRPGPNPTVDIVVFKKYENDLKILLIKRNNKSGTEVGKLSLPGGFQDTNSPKGKPWKNDRETARQAAFRELTEETGLYIPTLNKDLITVGEYEGENRDPRDNKEAWSKTTAFTILLPDNVSDNVQGRDDAESANWYSVKEILKQQIAFDHKKIIIDSLKKINL